MSQSDCTGYSPWLYDARVCIDGGLGKLGEWQFMFKALVTPWEAMRGHVFGSSTSKPLATPWLYDARDGVLKVG